MTTSDRCGSCHRDIFKMWRASKHADSVEGAAFLESFRQSQVAWGDDRSRVCLDCHAPMIAETGDWELREKVTWEGVSCDVCHSLVDVDLSGHGPRMQLEFGPIKRGPIIGAESTGHEVAYSPLHEKSLACAPCHEYASADGVPIMTTFSEWQNSQAAADGTTCQDCHMWRTKANIVDPRVKRIERAEVNLHEMPGGRSLHQLVKALDIEYDLVRTKEGIDVVVRIANVTGHAVPTGMPSREIILTVEVAAAETARQIDQRIFGKSFVDASGKPVEYTWGFFETGVRVDKDTRLAADSEWTETLSYSLPDDATAYFKIRLEYRNAMAEMQYEATRFEFFSERRTVKRGSGRLR
ncbi:MAG: multiheme c-type cytochrome [Gammaproteobacteria bacterium]|nr:multiheme c-type cytochrome [Gammaproteobacteria bacterium]